MKVKIIKASKRTYWYAEHIGEIFDVVSDPCNEDGYQCTKNRETFILKADTIKVSDKVSDKSKTIRLNYRLFEIYKSETGKEAIYDRDGRTYHTLDYVNWLEEQIYQP